VVAPFSAGHVRKFRRDLGMLLLFSGLVMASGPDGAAQNFSLVSVSNRGAEAATGAPQTPFTGGRKTFVDFTPAELAKEVRELKHLRPAESQDDLPQVLERTGATVAAFFDGFSNTTCNERIISSVSEPLNPADHYYDARVHYLALTPQGYDKTQLQELRTDSRGERVQLDPQEGVVTIGFVSMLGHFHPDFQQDSRFRLFGREMEGTEDAYVVAFAQRPEVARRTERIEFENKVGIVFVQGVAWIDPVSFNVIRLRIDIIQPESNVGLQKETTEVVYSQVSLGRGSKTLWLPREVKVDGQLGKYVFRTRHTYSDYQLFSVQIDDKPKGP